MPNKTRPEEQKSSPEPINALNNKNLIKIIYIYIYLNSTINELQSVGYNPALLINEMILFGGLQTTQPTSGGAVTVVSSCCANCVEPPRPQQWGPDLPFFGYAGHADRLDGWRCCMLTKSGDVETNPGQTTLNKKVWICDICHKQIHVRKQISIRCNRIEHWVHLRCAGIRQAQYTDTWTCHLHR